MGRPKKSIAIALSDRILDASEQLFAQHGIERVSLRQIGAAAGSSNHFAVQYHFGGKDQLVRAIFERRMSSLERRRSAALSALKGRQPTLHDLMRVLLQPVTEERDAKGRCTYAGFLMSMHYEHPGDLELLTIEFAPLTMHVIERIHETNTTVPTAISRRRLNSAFVLYVDVLRTIEQSDKKPRDLSALEDAINMAVAAMMAPVSPR